MEDADPSWRMKGGYPSPCLQIRRLQTLEIGTAWPAYLLFDEEEKILNEQLGDRQFALEIQYMVKKSLTRVGALGGNCPWSCDFSGHGQVQSRIADVLIFARNALCRTYRNILRRCNVGGGLIKICARQDCIL